MANKIAPHLWYTDNADEAAAFYASIFPDSRVDCVTPIASDNPSGPAGSVKVVEFTLCGQSFMAIGAGEHDPFNDAISLHVTCEDQAELDKYWNALLEGGGKAVACGWLTDRYGVRWQIAPRILGDLMKDKDRARAKRVGDAMLKMVKFDIATLERAARGD
jgi:predicted 3-demethylubiquinone-9 3-methyltransferase (glyoxalase superfamily)